MAAQAGGGVSNSLAGRVTTDLVGRGRSGLETAGAMIVLGIEALVVAVRDIATRKFSWSEFLLQAWFMSRVSVLPTILVAIPFGIIVSIQIGGVAGQIGAQSFSGAVNGIGVLRQGAPLVTSIMIAGAVGAAITSDLGARTIREEVDALKVMGINPVQRLVAPRVVAALVVAFFLNVVVAVTSIITGYTLNVGGGAVSSGTYISAFVSFAQPTDLFLASFKAVIFGFIATIVACHKGLTANGGPKGWPTRSTRPSSSASSRWPSSTSR
ncbi:MlaE family ABC transporter permease [Nocardioides alcanivorans]|uniref:MlaE family ABC transporter permease n=1 Tax=Nocardioides alcanivorans TaxID=2897352 RepID=UPI001F1CF744|nr:ABC transporter permease [Nocardioides alcanivorans]